MKSFTQITSVAVSLVIRLIDENVARVVHAVELHELVHEFEGDQRGSRLMNFLAQWILPEKCGVLSVLVFLLFDDLG